MICFTEPDFDTIVSALTERTQKCLFRFRCTPYSRYAPLQLKARVATKILWGSFDLLHYSCTELVRIKFLPQWLVATYDLSIVFQIAAEANRPSRAGADSRDSSFNILSGWSASSTLSTAQAAAETQSS